ncbi:hypothetical protein E9840_12105 [Tissierella creatinini]|nr:hypothetical protein E9840_12105 [Tissierella creatinini]
MWLYTYYAVLGFVLDSIIAIVPSTQLGLDLVFGIIYCIVGVLIRVGCGRLSLKMESGLNC